MLAVSRLLNPDCEHLEGDMRTLRLGRVFDVVFIHDAIDYMTTSQDLRHAMETAYVHCRAGVWRYLYRIMSARYFSLPLSTAATMRMAERYDFLEWTYDPDENDHTYVTDYAYLLREDGHPGVGGA